MEYSEVLMSNNSKRLTDVLLVVGYALLLAYLAAQF